VWVNEVQTSKRNKSVNISIVSKTLKVKITLMKILIKYFDCLTPSCAVEVLLRVSLFDCSGCLLFLVLLIHRCVFLDPYVEFGLVGKTLARRPQQPTSPTTPANTPDVSISNETLSTTKQLHTHTHTHTHTRFIGLLLSS
jgi:hypothetical protein